MIFESKKEYDELVGEVTQALETLNPKDKNQNPEKHGVGGEVPTKKLQTTSDSHSDSIRDPNVSSKNQPKYDGPFIENLEDRIYKVILELVQAPQQIGTTQTLGTSSGKEDPNDLTTPSKAARNATTVRVGGKVEKEAEKEIMALKKADPKAKEMKEKGDELNQRKDETEQTPPGPTPTSTSASPGPAPVTTPGL